MVATQPDRLVTAPREAELGLENRIYNARAQAVILVRVLVGLHVISSAHLAYLRKLYMYIHSVIIIVIANLHARDSYT